MEVSIRAKRVTGPLDDRVKARLRGDDHHRTLAGYVSSGSEHEASELSSLIHGFFLDVDDDAEPAGESCDLSDSGGDDRLDRSRSRTSPSSSAELIRNTLNNSVEEGGFQRGLVADVSKAVETVSRTRPSRSVFRRAVMVSLRENGYNAGLCKSRWRSSGSLTVGSYEYIDVVRSSPAAPAAEEERFIVDVEFAAEFEIARPTPEYGGVVAALPPVFVGKAEELKQVVRLLAKEAKLAFRSRDMHVPPWRKARYMQAKWLGPYLRTVNGLPSGSPALGRGVQLRSIGFDPAQSSRTCGGDLGKRGGEIRDLTSAIDSHYCGSRRTIATR